METVHCREKLRQLESMSAFGEGFGVGLPTKPPATFRYVALTQSMDGRSDGYGALYVVATPIGNLQDLSFRAVETLKTVDLIACEDTRHSATLLKAYDIHVPTTSYHSYSARAKERRILDRLREGARVALISDAGLPGVSDPGAGLIQGAIQDGIPVTVVPGASASLTGLVLSGFPTDRFVFEGFLSVKPGARRSRLERLREEPRTIVLYESPHRMRKLLHEIEAVFQDIPVSVSRELTKRFEETRRGPVSEVRVHFERETPRGEFVVVLPPKRLRTASTRPGGLARDLAPAETEEQGR